MRNPFIFEPEQFARYSGTPNHLEDGSLEYLERDPFAELQERGLGAELQEVGPGFLKMLASGAIVQRVQQMLNEAVFDVSLLVRFASGQIWNEDHLALEILFHRKPSLRPAQLDMVSGLKRLNRLAIKHQRELSPIRERIVRPIFGNPANFQVGPTGECVIQDLLEKVRKLGPLIAGRNDRGVYYKRNAGRSPRTQSAIDSIVLHHMAYNIGNDVDLYKRVGAHYIVTADGQIAQLYDDRDFLNASNCFNARSVAIEFAGNFRDHQDHWWKPRRSKSPIPDRCYLTPVQIRAGRCLLATLKARHPGIKYVYAHRQSSPRRPDDPGPDIWYHVGQWAVDNLGLSDGGPAFKCCNRRGTDCGNPIRDEWRVWGKRAGSAESNEVREEGGGYAPEISTGSDYCPTCGQREQRGLIWEDETPRRSPFRYVKDFSSSDAECAEALTRAGKTRAEALTIINAQIGLAIRMLRVAASKLQTSNRTAQTNATFRQIFRVPPSFVPSWLRPTATIRDRGDAVAARCRRVADLLASGRIRFFCSVNGTNCPDCAASSPDVYACSSWGQEGTAPQNSNVICLGTRTWDDMKNGNLASIRSTVMHEPFHIYYGIYVTEHGPRTGRSVGKFGGISCIVQFVFQINRQTPTPEDVGACAGTAVRNEVAAV